MRAKFHWVAEMTILSDHKPHRWEFPDFSPPPPVEAPDFDAIAEQVREEAYREGFDAGYAEGTATANDEISRFRGIIEQLAAPYRAVEPSIAKDLSALAVKLAKALIKRELHTDSSTIEATLGDALSVFSRLRGQVQITVNPQDASAVKALAPDLLDGTDWTINTDNNMLPGGTIVQTEHSLVDASVEQSIEKLFAEFADSTAQTLEQEVLDEP